MTTPGRFFRYPQGTMWRAESIARSSRAWSQNIESMRTKHTKLPRISPTGSREKRTGFERAGTPHGFSPKQSAMDGLRDKRSLHRLLAASLERFETVEILLHCAGKIKRAPTLDFLQSDSSDILDTNLTGTLRACHVFGQHMLSRKSGRIFSIASLNSFVAQHEVAAYAASKVGVAALVRALAVE